MEKTVMEVALIGLLAGFSVYPYAVLVLARVRIVDWFHVVAAAAGILHFNVEAYERWGRWGFLLTSAAACVAVLAAVRVRSRLEDDPDHRVTGQYFFGTVPPRVLNWVKE